MTGRRTFRRAARPGGSLATRMSTEGARVLALYSATEGVSAAVAGARLALSLAERGRRIALVHAEGTRVAPPPAIPAASSAFLPGAPASATLKSVALPRAAAPATPDPLAYVDAVESACGEADLVLIDCDPAFGPICGVLPLLADDFILLTTARPAALAEAYAALKWLHQRGLRGAARLIVLHGGDRQQAQRAARRLQRTAHQFLGRAATYVGSAPLERSARGAGPARRLPPPSPAQRAAWSAVADALLGAAPAGAESSNFWLRLAQLFL